MYAQHSKPMDEDAMASKLTKMLFSMNEADLEILGRAQSLLNEKNRRPMNKIDVVREALVCLAKTIEAENDAKKAV